MTQALLKQRREQLAELISAVSNPVVVAVVAIAIITSHYTTTLAQFIRWWTFGSLLLIGPAALYSYFTWRKEGQVDIDITNRQDRVVPLLLANFGCLIGVFLINSRFSNPTLASFGYTLLAMLLLLTIITIVWKVSFHAATLTAVASTVIIFRGPEFLWLYLLFIPVAWSRLVLKQHTPAQLAAGFLVGAAISYGSLLFFRR